jgi:hypothetical protein
MTEQHPADRPGHLDIDAVSAFVDRDFSPDELAMLAMHLHACPGCQREVLEIRTTVVLLAGLPQYTPRRSFCLGHEHARAFRRRSRAGNQPWSAGDLPPGYPAAARGASPRGAGWLPGLQAAAMVIGALLLLVTSSDLFGMPPQPADWLDEPEPVPMEFLAAPPPELAQPVPTAALAPDADLAPPAAAPENEAAAGIVADQAGGTVSDDSASEQVLTGDEPVRSAPAYATSAAIAAVTEAVPTPGSLAREPAAATEAREPDEGEPSRLRLVQIALAFALAWLVVSIVGLRWVRGVRGAPG